MGNSAPQWYSLHMPCPISGCPNGSKMISWVCAKDNTGMQVSQKGRLRCTAYNEHDAMIVNWRFDCGDRTGPHQNIHYLRPDFEGFVHAMAIGVAHTKEAGAEWVKELVTEIERQYKG